MNPMNRPRSILLNWRAEQMGMARSWRIRHVALRKLNKLFAHEWYFDHPYLATLYVSISNLVDRHASVANAVVDRIEMWERTKEEGEDYDEPVIDSVVFLVGVVGPLVCYEVWQDLLAIADAIKMDSL